jgi:hypothetical protein
MKKLLYTFLAVSIIFAACKKEEDDTTPVASIVGTWNTTKTTEDVAYTVSVAGVVMFDTAYIDIQTDSLDPSRLDFLDNGTLYVYGDGDFDTNTYVKNGNTLTITDVDTSFTLDINKLGANTLILVMEQDTAFTECGMDIVADITQTLEFARSTIINPTVSQRLGNTNHSWFTKPKLNDILKSIK